MSIKSFITLGPEQQEQQQRRRCWHGAKWASKQVFDADIFKPSLIFEGRAEAYQSGTPIGEIKNTRNIQNSNLQWQQQQKVSLKMQY